MKNLFVMDAMDYDIVLPEINRVAVRGIIFIDNKILMIEDNHGNIKLPGGGKEENETDIETLSREVKEETGYEVLLNTVVEFGKIEEKRMSVKEHKIWHQFSRLYFCKVDEKPGDCDYTEDEIQRGFRQVLYTLEEAIHKSKSIKSEPWQLREERTLELIQEHLMQE